MIWAVACCSALAAGLMVPSVPAWSARRPPRRPPLVMVGWGGAVLAAGMMGATSPARGLLLLIGAGTLLFMVRFIETRRRRRSAHVTAQRVLETCEHLAGELAAGQPPGAALERLAGEWALLAPVAEAMRVGADVPQAWRAAADNPGAGDLRVIAAAWQVAHRTGHGLAEGIARVARDLRETRSTRRVVDGELASARSTARLVAALPVFSLTMGTGAGGDPWGFLFGQPLGLACLAAGLTFGFAGLWWIEAIARGVEQPT